MPVTDTQVGCLRALLTRNFDEYERLIDELGHDGMRSGYFPLLTTAFLLAARAQFRGKNRTDMVEWVANVRVERDPNGQIDPNVAERLILWTFDKASVDDLDVKTIDGHQTVMLSLLVDEQGFDDTGLDAFLQQVREETDAALSKGEQG